MFPRWAGRVAAVAVAVVLAAYRSHSDVQYVSNTDGGVFLKVPRSWGVFTVAEGDLTPAQFTSPAEWKVVLDGAEKLQRSHIESDAPSDPVGIVDVIPTALFEDASGLNSHAGLRSLMLNGTDPVTEALTDPSIEVVKYEEVEMANGYWGNRLTITVTGENGVAQTLTQLAFVNKAFSRIYVLRLACESSCYDDNAAEIQSIIDSWTLRNP